MDFKEAQKNMRHAYLDGATGIFTSGLVWLIAGIIAMKGSVMTSLYVFFFGGMLIFPLSILFSKLLKRSGKHNKENPLGSLAMESTVLIFIGLFVAYTVYISVGDWFYSIMAMIIGGRYLMFQSIYGLKLYWVLGLAFIAIGVLTMVLLQDLHIAAIAGGVLEILFSFFVLASAKKIDKE